MLQQTQLTETKLYQGDDSFQRLRRFFKVTECNMNNSTKIETTISSDRQTKGYIFRLENINGIKKPISFKQPSENTSYSLRYFINMFNNSTNHFFGNTYRSPLIPIAIDEQTGHIRFTEQNLLQSYVLCPDTENDQCILQIVFVENTKNDNIIISQICEGWTIISIKDFVTGDINAFPSQQIPKRQSQLYKGSPRDLLFKDKNSLVRYEGATCDYQGIQYPKLEGIKFLLPDYVVLGSKDKLPGLAMGNLPENDENFQIDQDIKTVSFEDIYLKNIEIELDENIEKNIIEFATNYRAKIKGINERQLKKVYIKERKLKCGVHNTWCFVNSNGLENTISLIKEEGSNILKYKGGFHIDHFFSSELSLCAFVLELNYIVTVPIEENQKEEQLSLPVAYSVFVPNIANMESNMHKSYFITGPGVTVYGDHLWEPTQKIGKTIEINFILSKNKDSIEIPFPKSKTTFVPTQTIQQQNIEQSFLHNKVVEKTQPLPTIKVESYEPQQQQQQQHQQEQQPSTLEEHKLKTPSEYWNNAINDSKGISENTTIKNNKLSENNNSETPPPLQPQITTQYNVPGIPNSIKMQQPVLIYKEDQEYKSYLEFKKMQKLFEEHKQIPVNQIVKNAQPTSHIIYDPRTKDISKKDRAQYINKGLLNLDIDERNMQIIEFNLEKELNSHNLAQSIKFQFLAYKPPATLKNINDLPTRLQFKFSFWIFHDLESPICKLLPNDKDIQNLNNPFILHKDGSIITSENTEKDVYIRLDYDPSVETSIDFKEFITYLTTRQMSVEVIDVDRALSLGHIKVPLKDLIKQGKPKIYQHKEYDIYDYNFNYNGAIQLSLTCNEENTSRPFKYQPNLLRVVNSREGNNSSGSTKKKVRVKQVDLSKISNEYKDKIGQTLLSEKQRKNEQVLAQQLQNQNYNNYQPGAMKMNIDPEIEKRMRTMNYLKNHDELTNAQVEMLNQYERDKNKQNQNLLRKRNEEFSNQLAYISKYRDLRKKEIITKVSQETHKNEITISLIQGQPHYFNYIVSNESMNDELYHIIIEKGKTQNIGQYQQHDNSIVRVLNAREEWAKVVDFNKLIVPNNYDCISSDLYFTAKPNESIPLVIKVLAFEQLPSDTVFTILITKKNGQIMNCLTITIKKVFIVVDHIFQYYLPCGIEQLVTLVNPFKSHKEKVSKILDHYICSDNTVKLFLDSVSYDFKFQFRTNEEGFLHEFYIYLYFEKTCSYLYATWKFEINAMNLIELSSTLGAKVTRTLNIENHSTDIRNETKSLRLVTNAPDIMYFPDQRPQLDDNVVLLPSESITMRYTVYPKVSGEQKLLLYCVDCGAKEIFKKWLVKIQTSKPCIDETHTINCVIGSITNFKFEYTNPFNKWIQLYFDTNDKDYMEIIDKKVSFDANETKYIHISVGSQREMGLKEVTMFIYDQDEIFSRMILFKLLYK
jgi:hypothetical protein